MHAFQVFCAVALVPFALARPAIDNTLSARDSVLEEVQFTCAKGLIYHLCCADNEDPKAGQECEDGKVARSTFNTIADNAGAALEIQGGYSCATGALDKAQYPYCCAYQVNMSSSVSFSAAVVDHPTDLGRPCKLWKVQDPRAPSRARELVDMQVSQAE